MFPNAETGYLSAFLDPKQLATKLFVTSMLPPRAPVGTEPVVWPNADYDMRYWSMCNNLNTAPLPVVVPSGCLPGDAVKPDSKDSILVTLVVSTPELRPKSAVNW